MQTYTLRTLLRDRYDDLAQQLEAELQPENILEVFAVAQIIHDHIRLMSFDNAPDPDNPDIEKMRHRTALSLRRNMKDLRQLQTDRFLKAHLGLNLPGVVGVKDVYPFLKPQKTEAPANPASAPKPPAPPPSPEQAISQVEGKIASMLGMEQELYLENVDKRSQFPPSDRLNRPCPCGSGKKYSLCCAVGLPFSLPDAA